MTGDRRRGAADAFRMEGSRHGRVQQGPQSERNRQGTAGRKARFRSVRKGSAGPGGIRPGKGKEPYGQEKGKESGQDKESYGQDKAGQQYAEEKPEFGQEKQDQSGKGGQQQFEKQTQRQQGDEDLGDDSIDNQNLK